MQTISDEDIKRTPLSPLEVALRGESTLVTADGQAVMMAVPIGSKGNTAATLLDLAAQMYSSEEISLGRAAEIAGLPYLDMQDELGRRGIATLRLNPGELALELAAF